MLIDLDNDLVIVHIHNQNKPRGKAYDEFRVQFLTVLDNSLVKEEKNDYDGGKAKPPN